MLLNLLKIKFRNFLSFGSNWQEFELCNGINLITGLDKDNGRKNGAGKSALLDAIIFSLFGKTAKDIVQARIINWKNHKQCEVFIEFSKDDKTYRIERGLKPNYLKIFQDNEELEQSSNKGDFQKWIEENIIQMDYETFIALIYCNPSNQISLFNTSKTQKRKLLETLFNLSDYSKVSATALEKLKAIETQFNQFKISDSSISTKIEQYQNIIKNNKDKLNELNKAGLENILTQITNVINKKQSNEYCIDNVKNFDSILKNISKYKNKNSGLFLHTEATGNILELKQDVINISKEINELSNEKENIKVKLNEVKNNIKVNSSMIAKFKVDSRLESGAECPLCKSIVDINFIKKELEKEASPYLDTDLVLAKENTDLTQKMSQIDDLIASKNSELQNINNKINILRNNKKQRAINNLSQVYDKYQKIKENIDSKTQNDNELNELKQKRQIILTKLEGIDNQIEQLNKEILTNEENVKENNELLKNNENEEKKLLKLKDYFEYIRELCKDENVKQYAISNLIPYIEQQANKYLSSTGFSFYLDIDSFLDIEIKGPGITNSSYGNLSGAESKTVNIALQMALLDVCKAKSVVFPNILICDELLDGAVDSKGLDAMFEIIKTKQINDNLKVFVVSHRKEIQEIEFDKLYEVIKENGFSRVQEI